MQSSLNRLVFVSALGGVSTAAILSAINATTWLSTNYEFALLYGALRDAAIYLKEEADVVAMYEGKFTEAMVEIKQFGEQRASVDTYRTRS